MSLFYKYDSRNLPISYDMDVIVAGGGTAGAIAAIAAARSGVKVLLIEQFGGLGGTATQALVTPLMHSHINGNPLCSSISEEVNSKLIDLGYSFRDAGNNTGHFDPIILKMVLEEMAEESGVTLLYYTHIIDVIVENKTIKGLIVDNKSGTSAVLGKRIIDCTGDGDVAYKAGVEFEKGNPKTGKNQPISVRYMMSGVDVKKFADFLNENYGSCNYNPPIFHTAMVWGGSWGLKPLFQKALDAGDITYDDGAYWQVFGVPGRKDGLAFNCPEIFDNIDGTNAEHLTQAQIKGKKAILRHLKFYKKYFPGFEDAYITEIATQVGVRETRRFKGLYTLTDEDLILNRKFKDYISRCNYPIDIHGYELTNGRVDAKDKDPIPYYEVPFRCLVPQGIENLILAGRCISASFLANSSLRIQVVARATGEAAGIASALSITRDIGFAQLTGEEVRKEMERKGAKFE